MGEAAVRFENVSKAFRRGQLHDSLRDMVAAVFARLGGRTRERAGYFHALKDVSFAVARGEALGIIGPNGAGKSTSLKLLAGILKPDAGRVAVNGRLAALIEISAGMHGDLTGRENIYLNGAIMGMGRSEVERKLDAIVAFSGLEDFLDTPVKRYSTGMTARLGFSVAAHIDPDILLVDEVLSVGDVAFRQRCEARMRELVGAGTTLVFVTHNLEQMRSICHRAVVLDQGRVSFAGDPTGAVEHYMKATMNAVGEQSYMDCPRADRLPGRLLGLQFRDASGRVVRTVRSHQPVDVEMDFQLSTPVRKLCAEVSFRALNGGLFVNFNSGREDRLYDAPAGRSRVRVRLPALPLAGGHYVAWGRLWDNTECSLVAESPARVPLLIDDEGRPTGVLALPNAWPGQTELLEMREPAFALAGSHP